MKNRRRLISAVMTMMLVLFLTACADKKGNEAGDDIGNNIGSGLENSTADYGDMTPEDIVEKLYNDVDVPPYETVRLDKSTFEYFAFAPYDESLTAVAADALVNITPHSLVVIRAANGNGAEIAETIAQKADMNKWLCVGAEAGNVAYTDHYVVLIMSERAIVDAVTENFKAMADGLDGMEISLLTLTNSRYEQ